MANRKKYSKEFKLETIEMAELSEKSNFQLERELGLSNGSIGRWKRELQEFESNAFPGNGNPKDKEIAELRKELERTRRQRDILKKALAIFSKESM